MPDKKILTIICPVYNEEATIPLFYGRLAKAVAGLEGKYVLEFLFLNNRSSDGSLAVLKTLRAQDQRVKIITLSRNFGYQASVQAGMSYSNGDGIVVIDVDCEDPPEMIPQFVAKWEEGFDVVCGIRKERVEHWVIKKLRNVFYHLLQITADMDIVLYMAEFALISSTVRDAILNNKNTFPFLRAEIGYAGFSRHEIAYNREARVAGKTHYNLFRMVSFAVAGLLTSSTFLMRLAVYLLPVLAVVNVGLAAAAHGLGQPAWFYWAVVLDFLYVTFLITMHGIYMARIYKNAMGRPIYIVDPKNTYLDAGARKGQ